MTTMMRMLLMMVLVQGIIMTATMRTTKTTRNLTIRTLRPNQQRSSVSTYMRTTQTTTVMKNNQFQTQAVLQRAF